MALLQVSAEWKCVQSLEDLEVGYLFRTGFTWNREDNFAEVNMRVEEQFYFQGQWWEVSKMIS